MNACSNPAGFEKMSYEDVISWAINSLCKWSRWAQRWWYDLPGCDGLGCFGTGYQQWAAQTNQKYIGAMATLAAVGPEDQRDFALDRALRALRYELATHTTGHVDRTDGSRWGRTWISVLGLERMLYAMPNIQDRLTDADRDDLRRVLLSEAQWGLDEHERHGHKGIRAGKWAADGCNSPESNLWEGAFLWRVASMYPDNARADEMHERAHDFLINAASIDADAQDETIVAGKKVKDRHVGANFFPSYALDHHGYLNLGYSIITLSNAAFLHFDMRRLGCDTPESLYHHSADLWNSVRKMVFSNGRLARIGGDTRIPYTYCQEYMLPSLLYAADHLNERHTWGLLTNQLKMIDVESRANGDGSYYSARLGEMVQSSPYYYVRLESDRAAVLAMLVNYLPMVDKKKMPATTAAEYESQVEGGWIEPEHGAVMHRSPTRFVSFALRAHEGPQALCLPPDDGHMVDWRLNLVSMICCLGDSCQPLTNNHDRIRAIVEQNMSLFDGGFLASATIAEGNHNFVPEGLLLTNQATSRVVYCALPDGHTMLVMHRCTANIRVFTRAIKGMHLNIANDIFNGMKRTITTVSGDITLDAPPAHNEAISLKSPWACVNDKMGVVGLYGADSLVVDRCPTRRGGPFNGLHTEEICWTHNPRMTAWDKGDTILDIGFAATSSLDAKAVRKLHANATAETGTDDGVRALTVETAEGRKFRLVCNLGQSRADDIGLDPGEAKLDELAAPSPQNICHLNRRARSTREQ